MDRLQTLKQDHDKNLALKKLHQTDMSIKERREALLKDIKLKRKGGDPADEWEDVDEHEKEVFQATGGYFEIPDSEALISAADQDLLSKMQKKKDVKFTEQEGPNLADMIMLKLQTGDFIDGDKMDMKSNITTGAMSNLDPKIVAAYKKVGVVMKSYKSGKLPKAFKIIP